MKHIIVSSIILVMSFVGTSYCADFYDWSVRQDRDGTPAGIYTTTPIPVDKDSSTYSITNDEGTTTYNLGTIYYVDNGTAGCSSPSDNYYDPGTRTCGSGTEIVYNDLSIAISNVSSGNKTILVRAGTYIENYLVLKQGIDDTHRWSIIGYKQERPVVDGNGSRGHIFDDLPSGVAYTTIQRLRLQNNGQEGIVYGDWDNNGDGSYANTIDVEFYNMCSDGNACDGALHYTGTTGGLVSHIEIHHIKSGHGIKIADDASFLTVEWSKFYEIAYWDGIDRNPCRGHCIAIDLTSHDGYSPPDIGDSNIIRYNISYDNFNYCLQAENQKDLVVHHNEFYKCMRVYEVQDNPASWINSGTEGAYNVSFSSVPSARVYSNVFRNKMGNEESSNEHGQFQMFGSSSDITPGTVLIYNNLFWDDSSTTIEELVDFDGNLTPGVQIDFYNNTLYADTAGGTDTLLQSTWGGTVNVVNNIFYQAGTGSCVSGTVTSDYNLYYYPSGTLGKTAGANSIDNLDPLIHIPLGSYDSSDGLIQASSPAIDAGQDLSNLFTNEFAKTDNTRWAGAKFDMGAYKFISGVVIVRPKKPVNPLGQVNQ